MDKFKVVFLILLIPTLLFAKATLEVPRSYIQGDMVQFKIIASGKQIVIPNIKKVGNFNVKVAGTSTRTNIFNGKQTTTQIKTFSFYPKGDITIPTFGIQVDGKIYKTQPKFLQMKKVTKTVSELYSFDIKTNKNEAYVGEAIELSIDFKYKRDINILNLEFVTPDFSGFWVKKLKTKTPDDDPTYFNQTLTYLLFPQKKGKIDIGAFKINVVVSTSNNYTNSFFFTGATREIPVYSNTVNLNVKALPNGVGLIGEYDIKGLVDKTEVKAGEAISYKLKIIGEGNIDDIKELKPNIPNATIYENPAKKDFFIANGVYGGEYNKVFSIVASEDFTIPSIELSYFDKNSNSIKTVKTKEYKIKVKQPVVKEKSVLQTAPDTKQKLKQIVQKEQTTQNFPLLNGLFFVLGIIVTLGGFVVYKLFILKSDNTKEDTPLIVQVKKAKTADALLKVIVNYINIDKDLDKIIYQLEDKVNDKEFSKLKKEVVKIVKNMEISTF